MTTSRGTSDPRSAGAFDSTGEQADATVPRPIETAPGLVRANYRTPVFTPRRRDTAAAVSVELLEELAAISAEWTVCNRRELAARGRKQPTASAFREGLLRLGLKHINDPEFVDLIPPDGRQAGPPTQGA